MSRADLFRGKVTRIHYAAEAVRLLLTPLASEAEQPDVVPSGVYPREVFTGESGSLGIGWLSRDRITRDASRGGAVL